MGFRGGKGTREKAFNFTFSDGEVIGGYVLCTPMKAEESKYSNKDLKSGISLSLFFHTHRKNRPANMQIQTDSGPFIM